MKLNSASPAVYWSIFFVFSFVVFAIIAYAYIEPREIIVNPAQAEAIKQKIVLNAPLSVKEHQQIDHLIINIEATLPKILLTMKNPFEKMHVYENFYHVAMQENGVYTLVDYVTFMGDGISPTERYNHQGWGLLQVLSHMKGNSKDLIGEFITSADLLLTRRIVNAPEDESQLLIHWRKRLKTYHPKQ